MKLSPGFFLTLCSLSLFINPSISTHPDYPSLQSFKTTADAKHALISWNSDNPCAGNYLGVTCKNGRVTRLVLEHLSLTNNINALSNLDQLRILSLKNNSLTSSLPDFSPWKNMKLLYLSHNRFSGEIPTGISKLRRLLRLDLSHNNFTGHIPVSFNSDFLPLLITLRLEKNSLTGTIPLNLTEKLEGFNISDNYLVGEIPKSLSSFPESSFAGNLDLCGPPLLFQCRKDRVTSNPVSIRKQGKRIGKVGIAAIAISQVILVLGLAGIVVYVCRRKNQKQGKKKTETRGESRRRVIYTSSVCSHGEEGKEKMVFFEGCKSFRLDDLLRASAEMLGKGGMGSSYRATMENGFSVVVKRLRERINGRDGEHHLQLLGSLRNVNVVSPRAYYHSKEETLLVFDFLANGSLHSLLHGNRGPGRTPLDWTTRLKLAMGSAKGLAFLHRSCKSKLCHGNITSTNILVDRNGNACIADFALYQLFPSSCPLAKDALSEAYMAPELMNNRKKPSQRSDVYSFGVVLLEILTGRMAREGEVGLVKWVQCVVKEEWTSEVFDLELLRYKELEEEMVALLQVALLCLAPLSQNRPKMSIVYRMIEDIRVRGCGSALSPSRDCSSDSSPSLSENTPTTTSN